MSVVIALMLAGPPVCAEVPGRGAGEKKAMSAECDKGVVIVETTVGSIGPFQVGVGNIRRREGAGGVFEATLAIRREDAAPEAPLLFRGTVVAGDRVRVEGRTLAITRIESRPSRSSEPGSAQSYVCIVEE